MRINLIACAGILSLVSACGGSSLSAGAANSGDLRQGVVRSVVPLPAGTVGVRSESCTWTRDALRLLCPFEMADATTQIGLMAPDGSDFQCLTCGVSLEGTPGYLYAFADGQRFFYATLPAGSENASSGANLTPHIAACTPDIATCSAIAISDVALPTIAGDLNDREPRLSPDGKHYVWTVVRTDGFMILLGDLGQTASGYQVGNVRVLNPAPLPQNAKDWAIRGSFNEAKSFYRGRQLLFASTRDSGRNLDVYSLDIATGDVERITRNLEWDEDAQLDPTGKYLILGSARRMHNQLRATALADGPPFLDAAIIAATAPASLATDVMRLHTLEKWLTSVEEERAGRDGVMLNLKDGGWSSGAAKSPWSPDGTQAAWGERGPDGATRLLRVQFPSLARQSPVCADPENQLDCQTPTPDWAPPVEQYAPIPAGTYTIAGPKGGTAVFSFSGTILGPYNSVQYNGYVDANGRIADGTSSLTGISKGGGTMTIAADVAISGTAQGRTTANISAKGTLVCGQVDTRLDGRHLHTQVGQWNPDCGFATPERCPDGADADATDSGDCSEDQQPNKYAAPEWGAAAQ